MKHSSLPLWILKILGLYLVCLLKIDYIGRGDLVLLTCYFCCSFIGCLPLFIWVCKLDVGLLIELFSIQFVHIEERFGNLDFVKLLTHVAVN